MATYRDQRYQYNFSLPMGDFGTDESDVPIGSLPVLTGVDGRFRGHLRRFPGFRRLRDIDTGGATIDFFKYAEVQKGTTRYKLRGFVVRYGTTVIFDYYDTEVGAWATTPLTIDAASSDEIDITYSRRFLYYAKAGSVGCTVWYDGSTWQNETFGYYGTPTTTGTLIFSKDNTNGGILYNGIMPQLSIVVGYRFGHMARGVWSPLVFQQQNAAASGYGISTNDRYFVSSQEIAITAAEREFYDTIEVYRTINSGGTLYREIQLHAPTETGIANATLGDLKLYHTGTSPWHSATSWRDGGAEATRFWICPGWADGSCLVDDVMMIGGGVKAAGRALDERLTALAGEGVSEYDWVYDPVTATPKGARVCYFDGVLFKSREGSEDDRTIGEVQWTDTARLRPETFPVTNFYSIPRISDTIERFVIAGDAVYGVCSSRLYRFQKVGADMAVQLLQHGWGLLNRWSVAAVGESLAVVGPNALSLVNAANGATSTLSAVTNVLQDPLEWGASKSNMFVVYDSYGGVLFVANPDKEEALLVWGETNTVGRLVDMRFRGGTSGPHPETGGVDRAFFITPTGFILYPDLDRENATRTMMGIPDSEPIAVNGTFAGPVADTTIPLSVFGYTSNYGAFNNDFSWGFDVGTATPQDWTDAVIYVMHYVAGTLSSISRHVVLSYSEELESLQVSPAFGVAAGDRWSVSPVVFEVAGWPMGVDSDPRAPRNQFRRRRLGTIGFSLDVLGGSAPAAYQWMIPSAYAQVRDGPLTTVANAPPVAISEIADRTFGRVNVAGPTLLPALKCYTSDLDFKVRAMVAVGELEDTHNT